jgi:Ca2+-binding RTX toxin-like protein
MAITGTDGIDNLVGTELADEIIGLAGDDILDGLAGDDSLDGGEGSDLLTGGDGADTFHYGFTTTVEAGASSSFSGWLAEQGLAPLEDGVTTQGEFSSRYSAWLASVVESFGLGSDVDGDGDVDVDLNQNAATGTPLIEGMAQEDLDALFGDRDSLIVKTGKTTHERWFTDTIALPDETTVTTTAGTDTVTDFDAAEGDTLHFMGLSAEDFAALFSVVEGDAGGDGTLDTVITSSTDPSFSVTLAGVTGFDVTTDVMFA